MKKLLFVLLMGIIFTACEGPMGPPGRDGENAEPTRWIVKYYTIKSQDWVLVGQPNEMNSYFEYIIDEPALDDFIYEEGVLQVYNVINFNTANELFRPLPDNVFVGERDGYLWFENITYDYMPESIGFYVTYNDFLTDIPPGDLTFRVVMIY